MHTHKPLKQLFNRQDNWLKFLHNNKATLRTVVIENVTKMLACGTAAFGSREYHCSNSKCTHIKYIHQTCKSRACSSCGMKATERWIQKQQHVFPDCEYQHITFTLPSTLWPIFRHNRWLLNNLFKCATNILLGWAKKKKIDIGIFCALHTYGRKLNWNTHLHLSVTRGGICTETGLWKSIYFQLKTTEPCWRAAVINLLDNAYDALDLTAKDCPYIRNKTDWSHFLSSQYNRRWKLHFAKKTNNVKPTMNYLGRYLKRPPISASRLSHYAKGGMITFDYLDHRTGKTCSLTLPPEEMIRRIVEHLPEKHFKMIRYYGFLSMRRRGKALPKVYAALDMKVEAEPKMPCYASMLKGYVKVDPYECILCESRLVFRNFRVGNSVADLVTHAMIQSELRAA